PDNLKSDVEPGQMRSFFDKNEGILVFRAKDYSKVTSESTKTKKSYTILTTYHTNQREPVLDKNQQPREFQIATGRGKKRKIEFGGIMTAPIARRDYSKAKDPVDTSDLKSAASSPHKKHVKWYHRLV